MACQNWDQFLELMALLKNLDNQVHQVWIREPANIQFQDLLVQPFRHRQLTEKSKYENKEYPKSFLWENCDYWPEIAELVKSYMPNCSGVGRMSNQLDK